MYWSETGTCIIRKLDLSLSTVSTVIGAPRGCNSSVVGPALAAQFGAGFPAGFAFWGNNMIIADSTSIKYYSALNNSVSLMAGGGQQGRGGAYLASGFHAPHGIAVDASGDIYVADTVRAFDSLDVWQVILPRWVSRVSADCNDHRFMCHCSPTMPSVCYQMGK